MRKTVLAGIFAASLPFAAVNSQARGLPVVNSGAGSGVSVGGEIGFVNEDAGGGTALGATAGMGMGPLGASASVSRITPDNGATVWSQAASLSLRLFGGPLVPFRVTLQGGAGFWNEGAIDGIHVPISLGLAATIPNPAFAIRPWIAPRIDYVRETLNGVGDGDTNLAISGGIELGFLTGMSVRVSYDRILVDGASPSILSFGVGFSLGR